MKGYWVFSTRALLQLWEKVLLMGATDQCNTHEGSLIPSSLWPTQQGASVSDG